jgi:hypothetical protein
MVRNTAAPHLGNTVKNARPHESFAFIEVPIALPTKKLLAPRGSQESLVPANTSGTVTANPIAFEILFAA